MVRTVSVVGEGDAVGLDLIVTGGELDPLARIAEAVAAGRRVGVRVPTVEPADEVSVGAAVGFVVAAVAAGADALVTDEPHLARRVVHVLAAIESGGSTGEPGAEAVR